MTLTGAADRPTKTAIRRPASGVAISTHKLAAMRARRSMTRLQLAQRTLELDPLRWQDDEGLWHGGVSRDAIAKIENGQRRPKTSTLEKLCEALVCEPKDLLPGR
jgi:transcriptional regulator with XRE-family HTH domain